MAGAVVAPNIKNVEAFNRLTNLNRMSHQIAFNLQMQKAMRRELPAATPFPLTQELGEFLKPDTAGAGSPVIADPATQFDQCLRACYSAAPEQASSDAKVDNSGKAAAHAAGAMLQGILTAQSEDPPVSNEDLQRYTAIYAALVAYAKEAGVNQADFVKEANDGKNSFLATKKAVKEYFVPQSSTSASSSICAMVQGSLEQTSQAHKTQDVPKVHYNHNAEAFGVKLDENVVKEILELRAGSKDPTKMDQNRLKALKVLAGHVVVCEKTKVLRNAKGEAYEYGKTPDVGVIHMCWRNFEEAGTPDFQKFTKSDGTIDVAALQASLVSTMKLAMNAAIEQKFDGAVLVMPDKFVKGYPGGKAAYQEVYDAALLEVAKDPKYAGKRIATDHEVKVPAGQKLLTNIINGRGKDALSLGAEFNLAVGINATALEKFGHPGAERLALLEQNIAARVAPPVHLCRPDRLQLQSHDISLGQGQAKKGERLMTERQEAIIVALNTASDADKNALIKEFNEISKTEAQGKGKVPFELKEAKHSKDKDKEHKKLKLVFQDPGDKTAEKNANLYYEIKDGKPVLVKTSFGKDASCEVEFNHPQHGRSKITVEKQEVTLTVGGKTYSTASKAAAAGGKDEEGEEVAAAAEVPEDPALIAAAAGGKDEEEVPEAAAGADEVRREARAIAKHALQKGQETEGVKVEDRSGTKTAANRGAAKIVLPH